jgi:hypothetical protein
MSSRGAVIAAIIVFAFSSAACERVRAQEQFHPATGGDANPATGGKVAAVKSGGPAVSGQPATAAAPKSQDLERVYAFSYLGDMDRPVFPTLIGNTQKAMDHFVAAHAKDPLLPHGLQVVTTADALACIARALKKAEAEAKSNQAVNPERKAAQPLLAVSDWSAVGERTARFPAASGLALLRSAEKCLKKSDAKPGSSLDALIALLSR